MDAKANTKRRKKKKSCGIIKNISPYMFICGEYEYEYHEPAGKYKFG